MSGFEVVLLSISGVSVVLISVRSVIRRHRINRVELSREPGAVHSDPVFGAWTPGRPGQAARFYTGEAPAHGTNSYGDGTFRS